MNRRANCAPGGVSRKIKIVDATCSRQAIDLASLPSPYGVEQSGIFARPGRCRIARSASFILRNARSTAAFGTLCIYFSIRGTTWVGSVGHPVSPMLGIAKSSALQRPCRRLARFHAGAIDLFLSTLAAAATSTVQLTVITA